MSFILAIVMALTVGTGWMGISKDSGASPAAQVQSQGKVPYDCKAPCRIDDPDCTCGTGGK